MSVSWLYQAFGFRGYEYVGTKIEHGEVLARIERAPICPGLPRLRERPNFRREISVGERSSRAWHDPLASALEKSSLKKNHCQELIDRVALTRGPLNN